jgi:hypothetical protein
MTTITEFLLARVAEDEADARACIDDDPHWLADGDDILQGDAGFATTSGYFTQTRRPLANTHIARHDPARVLRQCEAIRRIVPIADAQSKWDALGSATDEDGWAILEALAAIWSDHPDHGGWWAA